jgi:hypothetical protein
VNVRPPFYDTGTEGGIPGYIPGQFFDPQGFNPPFAVAPPPGAVFNPLAPGGWQAGFPIGPGVGPGRSWTRLMGTAYGNAYAGGGPRGAALTRTRLVRCCPCAPDSATGRVYPITPPRRLPVGPPVGGIPPRGIPYIPPSPVGANSPTGRVVGGPMVGGGVDPEMADELAPGLQMTAERKPFPWVLVALAALGLRG